MKKLTFLLLILMYVSAYSQPTVHYDENYGGADLDRACDMIELADGSLLMAGYTSSYGAGMEDIWLYSRAPGDDRSLDWSVTIGWDDDEQADAIAYFDEEIAGEGFLIGGMTQSNISPQTNFEMLLVKTDLSGEIIWDKRYGEGRIYEIIVSDDGYLLCGSKIIKTDFDGIVSWTYDMSTLNGVEVPGSGYYFGRSMNNFVTLIKINYDGTPGGTVAVTESGSGYVSAVNRIITTSDGGFLMGITSDSYGAGLLDARLIKTNGEGVLQWSETYGSVFHDECNDVCTTIDGGYIMAGLTQENGTSDNDFWVIKVDANGTIQWDWTENLPYRNWTSAILQTSDNGYAVTGFVNLDGVDNDDYRLIKFSPEEFTAWFTGFPTSIEPGEDVQFNSGSLGSPGENYTYQWTFDMGEGEDIIITNNLSPVVPYPNEGLYTVKLDWFDSEGTLISSMERTEYISVGITVGPPSGYCTSNGVANDNWIKLVSMNGLSNSSGSSGIIGYENYTNLIFDVEAGGTYDIILDPGSIPSQKKVAKNWRVWIDFDMDGDFDGNEVLAINNKKGEVTGSISIPVDFSGITRMRVSMSTQMIPVFCGNIMSGEVEDYLIQAEEATPQPPIADFYAEPVQVTTANPVLFYDQSINNPDTYLWDFGDGATSTEQNPQHEYSFIGQYTVSLTVSNSLGTDTEEKVEYITVSNSTASYCIPQNLSNSLMTNIREVKIDEINNNTGMNEYAYTYYSFLPPFELMIGGSHTFILTPGDTRARNFWRLWIDFDNSQTFDEDELLITANNKKGIITQDIIMPDNLVNGFETRMRVSMKKGGAQSGPCEGDFEGEVEDYDIIFVDGQKSMLLGSEGDKQNVINIYPNPVKGDQITLVLTANGNNSIEIINKYGSVIDKFESGDSRINLNVSGYASGVYFVKVMHAGTIEVKKFIKR